MGYIAYIYADLIRKGNKTIDQVPEVVREEVESILENTEGTKSGSAAE